MSDVAGHHLGSVDGLNLAVSLCLTYTLCIVCVRLWIRKGAFGYDDFVVLIATVVTLGHTASDYVALANGLGKPWQTVTSDGDVPPLNAASIAGIVTFVLALYLSKIAVLAFLARITKNKSQLVLYLACSVGFAAFAVASALVVTIGCPVKRDFYWAFAANADACPSQSIRWQVVTALDVVTELALLLLPIQLVWALQMPLQKKAMVLTAFYLRLPVIGLSLGRNYYTLDLNDSGPDPSPSAAFVVIWLEIELAYALAANTFSTLKAFTESFNSSFGLGFTRAARETYDMSGLSGTSGRSSKTEKQKSSSGIRSSDSTPHKSDADVSITALPSLRHAKPKDRPLKLRPGNEGENVTRVSADPLGADRPFHHPQQSCCSASDSSDGINGNTNSNSMFIMRETELSVHHDRAPMLR